VLEKRKVAALRYWNHRLLIFLFIWWIYYCFWSFYWIIFRWEIQQKVQLLKQVFDWLAYIDVFLGWNFVITYKAKILSEFMRLNWLVRSLLVEVHLIGNKNFYNIGAEFRLNFFVPISNFVKWIPIWDVKNKYDTVCLLLNGLWKHVRSVSLVPKMRFYHVCAKW